MDEPFPGTPLFEKMSSFDFYGDDWVVIKSAKVKADQLPKELVFIPGLLLLGLIYMLQLARVRREEETA